MTINFAPGDLVRARGREWVALPSPRDGVLALRPLSGGENDTVVLDPVLELLPVEPARFDLPVDATVTVQAKAALLADAMRLTLRRGAGPFRSAAQLAFEPRIYQLVPLLMSLRLAVPRLLIADDVGIGKTIEAGLILRELMDRGEVDAFSVLCPPHLVEQWVGELKARFGIDAVPVTSGTASRLERGLPLAQTLFDAYPFTVVSLDYIKAEKRREGFARACPDFVIVDEAHACVGTHQGRQQRFELLSGLALNPERRMILLTATPHSGDEEAFARLLSLVDPSFASMDFEDTRYRERLARHFVQRRRIDLVSGDWDEDRAFPKHETTEFAYRLSEAHRAFQEAVLDYGLGVSLPDAPLQEFERRVAGLPRTTEAERLVVQRIGQDVFRDRLMDYWQGRCPLTGISDPALLRASHIIPWADCESDAERLDVHNGLLLSALWDAAFDRTLVAFDDQGRPEFSPSLSEEARAELRWKAPIALTDEHRRRLARHRERAAGGGA